jgi:rod shape-determining protein MreD
MIRSIIATCILAILALLVQATWLGNGIFFGVVPDFALLVIIWVAYNNQNNEGSIAAFISGLSADIISSAPLGYFAFIYLLPAYLVSLMRGYIVLDRVILPFLLGIAATLLKWLASAFLSVLFGSGKVNSYSLGDYHFWLEALMNGILAPIVFRLLGLMKSWLITRQRKG